MYTPLDQTSTAFDNQTLNYDIKKYPFSKIVLEVVQKYYPDISDLENLHEVVPANKVEDLMRKASRDILDTPFWDYYDQMVQEQIVPKIGKEVLIQKFGNIRAVIPNQDRIGAVLLWHQGRWVGNGLGLRTIWMPFTKCYESNSMQILDLDISRKLTKQMVKEKWPYKKLAEECEKHCWPVTLEPGQAHLFFQEHLHGNIVNTTGKTRVSIDIRILVKDGQPHRKWPGSYFRPLFDRDWTRNVSVEPNDVVVTFSEYDGFKTRNIDLYFQTQTIKSYCDKRNIAFPYQHGDNEGTGRAFFEHLVKTNKMDHLLLFSIFSLPDEKEKRIKWLNTFLERKIRVHFCNEEMILETQEDLEKIEYIRSFTDDWSSPVDQLREYLKNNS